ncbi:MAG: pyridoxal phosphate-dependent aminotransferase [Clostridia bacterium]|nr:pyridoxal phosphate-dependent aminotransferase [Clostridia bacterium]
MFSKEMYELGAHSSVIREIFEYAKKRTEVVGKENIFDFSIGNPSVPAPEIVNETIKKLVDTVPSTELHGYTSAVGDNSVREAIAGYLNKTYGTSFRKENFYMTVGAAASLTITLTALHEEGDEVIILAPFFPEYRVFAEKAGMKPVIVLSDEKTLLPDFAAIENAITEHTKAVIINSPNNPSGVVLDEECVKTLSALLEKKQKEFGKPIFIISDEPYRELVYGNVKVPFMTKYYDNTIVCYSFSKSLSLPGERIGYILVPDEAASSGELFKAVCGAGRALGYVCAPALFQFVIKECLGKTSDISVYEKNRDLLIKTAERLGFSCAKPDGAFYLFMKSPEKDAAAFCEKAKKYELLFVPSDSFGFPGYVRIAYCVSTEMIEKAIPAFEKLAKEYF